MIDCIQKCHPTIKVICTGVSLPPVLPIQSLQIPLHPLHDPEFITLLQSSMENNPLLWIHWSPTSPSEHLPLTTPLLGLWKDTLLFISTLIIPKLTLYSRQISEVFTWMLTMWRGVLVHMYTQEKLVFLITGWLSNTTTTTTTTTTTETINYNTVLTSIKACVMGLQLLDQVVPKLVQYTAKTSGRSIANNAFPPVMHRKSGSGGGTKRPCIVQVDDYDSFNVHTCKYLICMIMCY